MFFMNTNSHPRILFLDGSPASPSRVAKLLFTIEEQAKGEGCTTEVIELASLSLPFNDPAYHLNPQEHPNAGVQTLVSAVAKADIIVLGTPLYHGSYSGLLKTALDHLQDDAFAGKAIGLVSNSNNIRNSMQAAQELVVVARTMKGRVSDCLIGTCHEDFGIKDEIFQVINPAIRNRITIFVKDLIAEV